jgi:hypothetical protein
MTGLLLPHPTPARAAAILRDVFGGVADGVAFRLWDGTEVRLGARAPFATAVIKSPETFIRLLEAPTPYNFAVAYVESAVDIEGDLFATMEVANAVEEIRLSPVRKLRLLLSLWRP